MTISRPDRSDRHTATITAALTRQVSTGEPKRSAKRRFPAYPLIAACWFLALVLVAGMATAQVTSVTVDESKPFEKVSGYTYVQATMHGTVERDDGSVGEYSVPMVLIYPDDGGNGVGVVDWPNSQPYRVAGHDDPDEFATLQLARLTTDDYLFENGYTYASVQWSKEVTELFGPDAPDDREYNHLVYGTIDRGTDTFPILRDAARFLRDPSAFDGDAGPMPVDWVLSFGFSQTAALQMEFLVQGENTVDGERAYDGHLLGAGGFLCLAPNDEEPLYSEGGPCEGRPADDGSKMITIQAQGDLEAFFISALSRFPDVDNWRQYELAGVSHLPAVVLPVLSENQNPADFRPAFRAAFHNLKLWTTEGITPPPSKFLEGKVIPEGEELAGTLITDLDEDGNALGGLRLPHMEQIIDGEVAGAPLGTYTGLKAVDLEALEAAIAADGGAYTPDDRFYRLYVAEEAPIVAVGGTFTPFSDEELRERYPDHETYVNRVTRAADYLLAGGYILEEDRDAYVREAEQSSIGK